MDALSDRNIPLSLRTHAANCSLELMNATIDYYRDMEWNDSFERYQKAKAEYDKALRDLTLFYPE